MPIFFDRYDTIEEADTGVLSLDAIYAEKDPISMLPKKTLTSYSLRQQTSTDKWIVCRYEKYEGSKTSK